MLSVVQCAYSMVEMSQIHLVPLPIIIEDDSGSMQRNNRQLLVGAWIGVLGHTFVFRELHVCNTYVRTLDGSGHKRLIVQLFHFIVLTAC